MITIWKFPLKIDDVQEIELPADNKLLSVGLQNDRPVLWAMVDTNKPNVKITLEMIGTGNPITGHSELFVRKVTSSLQFIGTIQMASGLVLHVFESLK